MPVPEKGPVKRVSVTACCAGRSAQDELPDKPLPMTALGILLISVELIRINDINSHSHYQFKFINKVLLKAVLI
ncbi:MAG: hypothetical protein ACRCU9_05345 [Iodobacter sp.]